MRSSRIGLPFAYVAALLAVALLTSASVRSNVMRAAELSPSASPMCAMAAMAGAPRDPGGDARGKAHKVCEFCAAAAHAPVLASTTPILVPAAVTWVARSPVATLGPRGPPARAPNARGPPLSI